MQSWYCKMILLLLFAFSLSTGETAEVCPQSCTCKDGSGGYFNASNFDTITCTGLSKIPRNIPTSVRQLMFQNGNVTHIHNYAFWSLKRLQYLAFYSDPISSIGRKAFDGLTNIQQMEFGGASLPCTCDVYKALRVCWSSGRCKLSGDCVDGMRLRDLGKACESPKPTDSQGWHRTRPWFVNTTPYGNVGHNHTRRWRRTRPWMVNTTPYGNVGHNHTRRWRRRRPWLVNTTPYGNVGHNHTRRWRRSRRWRRTRQRFANTTPYPGLRQ